MCTDNNLTSASLNSDHFPHFHLFLLSLIIILLFLLHIFILLGDLHGEVVTPLLCDPEIIGSAWAMTPISQVFFFLDLWRSSLQLKGLCPE